MILQGKNKVPVREAVLHCAAIRTGQFEGKGPFEVFSIINRWHTERGFVNGFGYHGFILPDGTYYSGRPFAMTGAHVMGHNAGTLGFLLIESKQIRYIGEFDDWFTKWQRQRLRVILKGIPGLEKVTGHNDHAAKLCPGFYVKTADWL